jgi:hypothetical protein
MGDFTNAIVNIKQHTIFIGAGTYVKTPYIVFPFQLMRRLPAVGFLVAERFQGLQNICLIPAWYIHGAFFETNRAGKKGAIDYLADGIFLLFPAGFML